MPAAWPRFLTNEASAPHPFPLDQPTIAPLPEEGLGQAAVPDLWQAIAAGATHLSNPTMMGHMDTAPHPVAALTDALISALNNNLLFRELSPMASAVEESLLRDFAQRVGYGPKSRGLFCAGGSLANLTALFAALGGFKPTVSRDRAELFLSDAAHGSVMKAAAVLGLSPAAVVQVPSDPQGAMDPEALSKALRASRAERKIVAAVFGSTIHGTVDALPRLAAVCATQGAWFHVDAIYGGALVFSRRNRGLLTGLERADSIAIGPQKWLYVPRLSALVLMRDAARFESALGREVPYSISGEPHLGRWGLQGSRRADALTLWVLLQTLGTRQMGEMIDRSIGLAELFWSRLADHDQAEPTHRPLLNLQCFRWGPPDREGTRLTALHRALSQANGPLGQPDTLAR